MQACIQRSCCHCHSLSLASVESRLVLHFWYQLTRVVLDKEPLNGCVLSRTTRVSRYQKSKTSLDLKEARASGFWDSSGIGWTTCKQSAPRSRQITTPTTHHSNFLQAGCSSWRPTDSVKALKVHRKRTLKRNYTNELRGSRSIYEWLECTVSDTVVKTFLRFLLISLRFQVFNVFLLFQRFYYKKTLVKI